MPVVAEQLVIYLLLYLVPRIFRRLGGKMSKYFSMLTDLFRLHYEFFYERNNLQFKMAHLKGAHRQ